MAQASNPHLAELTVTLLDGVPRRFCWDFHAQIMVIEGRKRIPYQNNPFASLLLFLFAGLHRDAVERGEQESWTPGQVEKLVPPDSNKITAMLLEIQRAIAEAKDGPGESRAAGATVAGGRRKAGRSIGAKR